jgi:hypothetical protein
MPLDSMGWIRHSLQVVLRAASAAGPPRMTSNIVSGLICLFPRPCVVRARTI